MTELREKDVAVLQAVQDGASTVTEIKERTTLTTREINYSITEYGLEELGLVTVSRSNGREWREENGREEYVWKPKTIEITDEGLQALADAGIGADSYEDLSKRELIEQVHALETRVDRLENEFSDFRRKIIDRLKQGGRQK